MALTSSRFPYLPLGLQLGQRVYQGEALIDTGFDRAVAVPPVLIDGQQPDWYEEWELADGSKPFVPSYQGSLQIDNLGLPLVWVIALGKEVLLGLAVISHFTLILDHGQQVIVEP